jgi:argininosuccinate lyase
MNSARSTKLLATDLADYLAKRGLPFRQAHQVVRDLIEHVTEENKALNQVSIEEYHSFSPLFDRDVYSITIETSLASRDAPGSTAPSQVSKALARAREILRSHYE